MTDDKKILTVELDGNVSEKVQEAFQDAVIQLADAYSQIATLERFARENAGVQGGFSAAANAVAVGAMLATVRTRGGMSQRAVAGEIGIDAKSVRELERGKNSPSLRIVERHANALGYTAQVVLVPITPENE